MMDENYVPDPLEILEAQIERNIDEYEEGHCMACGKKVDYELIPVSPHPAAKVVCYECLPPDAREAYDAFEKGDTCPTN